jgi:hypothetical protein
VSCLDEEGLALLGAVGSLRGRCLRAHVPRAPLHKKLAPRAFGAVLSELVKHYKRRGANVLAHCRGINGRMGLVGSWCVLRPGLCGWVGDAGEAACHLRGDTRARQARDRHCAADAFSRRSKYTGKSAFSSSTSSFCAPKACAREEQQEEEW